MLDVMAVGHADGCVVLVDLKQDAAVMRLQHDDGAVSKAKDRVGDPCAAVMQKEFI